jgi:predicted alpha-1,6-mannanase (GH76 family)
MFNCYSNAFYSQRGINASFKDTQAGGTADFWKQAEEIECIIDAYEWTTNSVCLQMVTNLLNGFADSHGTNWSHNIYNDDCMWASIAFVRGYLDTGNIWFRTIAKSNFDMAYSRGWDTNYGGGMWWTTEKTGKNACVNGPASIAAYLLYQSLGDSTYLSKAANLYFWERTNLFAVTDGSVYDRLDSGGASGPPTTYNQGTFIGAADFLDQTNDAMLAANYTKRFMCSRSGILPQYGIAGNNSGFNAIFIRWLARFMKHRGVQNIYQPWLLDNANAAWKTRRREDNLSWCQWRRLTPVGTNLCSWDCVASLEIMQLAPTIWSSVKQLAGQSTNSP